MQCLKQAGFYIYSVCSCLPGRRGTNPPPCTLLQVWKMGQFGTDSKLNPSEVLTLLLTTTTSSFAAVVSGLFDVFGQGGRLDRDTFLALLDSLAKWDTGITQPMRSSLKDSLRSIEFLSFADLQQNPVIGDRLTKRNA